MSSPLFDKLPEENSKVGAIPKNPWNPQPNSKVSHPPLDPVYAGFDIIILSPAASITSGKTKSKPSLNTNPPRLASVSPLLVISINSRLS